MNPTKRDARIAGLLYLLMAMPAPYILIYVPNKLIVAGNAAATAGNILAHEAMFRWSMAIDFLDGVIFVLLAFALYRLLRGVNQQLATLMVTLVVMAVTLGYFDELFNLGALTLFRGADFLSVFNEVQRQALGMLFLRIHRDGVMVIQIFWGLWLFPFGWLVYRSGFIPRIFGILLIANGFVYPVLSFSWLVRGSALSVFSPVAFMLEMGEIWIMLWLLIKGTDERRALTPAIA